MVKAKKEEDVGGDVVAHIRGMFGAASAVRLTDTAALSQLREAIPTGVEVLDRYVLGVGGFPVGKMTEVFGAEGCGKTSLALAAAAHAQRLGGLAIYVDTERAVQIERATVFGVDVPSLILLQPNSMEEAINQACESLAKIPEGYGPVLLVWDSIAATAPQAEIDAAAGENKMGVAARLMNFACRKLNPLTSRRRVALVFINQVRDKIGIAFGDPTTTPGGAGPKFYASIRLQMWPGKVGQDADGQPVCKDITIKAVKHRFVTPHRKAKVRLDFAAGWDSDWSTIEHAKEHDLIAGNAHGNKALKEAIEKLKWSTHEEAAQEETK